VNRRTAILQDVCEISMGQAPQGDSYNTESNGYPLIAGAGDFGDITPLPKKYTTEPTKLSRVDDIILCIRATIGDRNWADSVYCLGRGVSGLRADPAQLNQKYLWHWLGNAADHLRSKGRGATFLQVNRADIGSMEIPLPPLPEQRRIAAILDKADALRAKRRQAIAKLDQLLQSVFLEMFGDPSEGWPLASVGLIAQVQGGLQLSAARQSIPTKSPYLRVANVYRGKLNLTEIKEMGVTPSELSRTRLQPNDILVVEGHGNPEEIGRCAMWNGAVEECTHQNHLIRVRVSDERIRPEFLETYLNSSAGRSHLTGSARTTSGLNTISVTKVKEVPLRVPPITIQKRWEQIKHSAQALVQSHEECLNRTDELNATLQTSLLAGA